MVYFFIGTSPFEKGLEGCKVSNVNVTLFCMENEFSNAYQKETYITFDLPLNRYPNFRTRNRYRRVS